MDLEVLVGVALDDGPRGVERPRERARDHGVDAAVAQRRGEQLGLHHSFGGQRQVQLALDPSRAVPGRLSVADEVEVHEVSGHTGRHPGRRRRRVHPALLSAEIAGQRRQNGAAQNSWRAGAPLPARAHGVQQHCGRGGKCDGGQGLLRRGGVAHRGCGALNSHASVPLLLNLRRSAALPRRCLHACCPSAPEAREVDDRRRRWVRGVLCLRRSRDVYGGRSRAGSLELLLCLASCSSGELPCQRQISGSSASRRCRSKRATINNIKHTCRRVRAIGE
eukprot:scaffold7059_cov250-Pinguiococcus_pyrenoidosus.AAC.5